MNIGILGGTFDPFHNGHLEMAKAVLQNGFVEKLYLLPSGNPPHKSCISKEGQRHRRNMLELVAKEIKGCEIEEYELLHSEQKTYTVNVLSQLEKIYPNDTIHFILGGDSFMNLERWYRFQDLLGGYSLLVFSREGIRKECLYEKKEFFQEQFSPQSILIMEETVPNCASTQIKLLRKQGKSIEEFVPCAIWKYIEKNQLYI